MIPMVEDTLWTTIWHKICSSGQVTARVSELLIHTYQVRLAPVLLYNFPITVGRPRSSTLLPLALAPRAHLALT